MGIAAIEAESAGFDEININCGCPSKYSKTNRFGAVLMTDPEAIVTCV